jgi:hypothetical protein
MPAKGSVRAFSLSGLPRMGIVFRVVLTAAAGWRGATVGAIARAR